MAVGLPTLHLAEGITIDVLFRVVYCVLLSPSLASLCTLALLVNRREILLRRDWSGLLEVWGRDGFLRVFVGFMGLLLLLNVNEWLSRGARNNWQGTRRGEWDWREGGGEVVVVTGGTNGIGRGVAEELARRGIKVAVLDVLEPAEPLPPSAQFFRCDLASKSEVDEVAGRVVEAMGHPTVLVNGAGVVRSRSILESTERDVALTYDVNVKAHYWTVQAFLPEMIRRGKGHVITIASTTAFIQAPLGVAYCSSKSAALSFHEGLTLELRHTLSPSTPAGRIRTSLLCPGHVQTAMFSGLDQGPWISQWLMPSLKVETVVGLIVQTVLSGESQYIIEPLAAKLMPWFRVMPTWMSAGLHSFAKDAMGGVRDVQQRVRKDGGKKEL